MRNFPGGQHRSILYVEKTKAKQANCVESFEYENTTFEYREYKFRTFSYPQSIV